MFEALHDMWLQLAFGDFLGSLISVQIFYRAMD
jgi:hypothetical protein